MAMSDLFLAALILVYNLVFLVNESNLNRIVAIVFNSLDLSYTGQPEVLLRASMFRLR
jgi:hypothetical protein